VKVKKSTREEDNYNNEGTFVVNGISVACHISSGKPEAQHTSLDEASWGKCLVDRVRQW